jgi:uncharacterized protein
MTTAGPMPKAAVRETPPRSPGRLIEVDALRGVALFGIIIVNAPFFAAPLGQVGVAATLDLVAAWMIAAFFAGKFFLIFSFLFGFGFAAAVAHAANSGEMSAWRIRRRAIGLFVIGALHAVFLFHGDILALYAVLSLALWAVRGWTARQLLRAAVIVGLAGMALQFLALIAAFDETPRLVAATATRPGEGYLGGFRAGASARLAELPDAQSFIVAFNGLPAFAMFLLGLALGRTGSFPPGPDTLAGHRLSVRLAFAGAAVTSGVAAAAIGGSSNVSVQLVGLALLVAAAPVLSCALAAMVLDVAARNRDSVPVRWLAITGGSSLTGYILHSVLLGAVFYGWGLGWHGRWGAAAVMATGVGTFVIVMVSINLWRAVFRYGPEEWLLRSFVDLRWKPLFNHAAPRPD